MKKLAYSLITIVLVIGLIGLYPSTGSAKGAIHGTFTLSDGPPDTAVLVTIGAVFESIMPPPGPGDFTVGNQLYHGRFDAVGTLVVHFAFTDLALLDITALRFAVIVRDMTDTIIVVVFPVAQDIDGDGIIGARDIQSLEAVVP